MHSSIHKRFRRVPAVALGLFLTFSLSAVAFAGPMKFGEGMNSLETDDKGELTAEGKKTVLKELDKIPDEDAWDLNLWAELERGRAEGPIYVEFRR